jgi:RNA polymerase sigma-70 factor, ECF subfamily
MSQTAKPGAPEPDERTTDLLRRWQEHEDLDALDELLRSEIRILKDIVSARAADQLGGSASASDIAQEAALRLLRLETVPKFADPRALRAYLWTTARRLLIDRVRRPYTCKQSLDPSASSQLPAALIATTGRQTDEAERTAAIDVAMNLLRPEDRDLIHRVYFEGRTLSDLAGDLHVSESAVKMRLLRARRNLGARLSTWGDTVG